MGSTELDRIRLSLDNARTPEEVFGTLKGTQTERLDAARRVFRQIAKAVHPDLYLGTTDFESANATFKQLAHFWEQAQARIEKGIYGISKGTETFTPFTIRTKKGQYNVEKFLAQGDLCNLYMGISNFTGAQKRVLLKFPLSPEDNDLITNETHILAHLKKGKKYEKLRYFVSQLVDSFSYEEKTSGAIRQVNVLSYKEGLYSLKEVKEAYPTGIDVMDMAWIWRRLLVALGFAHSNNIIHGAVLPTHILISPGEHAVILIDWSYAVLQPATTDECIPCISAISSEYREWYPAEVFAKEEPTPSLDVIMAARCMIDLLNGDPHKRTLPDAVPWQIQSHLKGCTLPKPQQRPQDTSVLLKDFDTLIERLWGPRKFHQFSMPQRCAKF